MIRILCAALLLTCAHAQAAPPCWPKQIGGTGSDYKTGDTADGTWLGWTCTAKGHTGAVGVWAVKGWGIPNMTRPDTKGLTGVKAAKAFWEANVRPSNDPRHARLYENMLASFR